VRSDVRRVVVVDALLGLVVALACWLGAQFTWVAPEIRGGRGPRDRHGPDFHPVLVQLSPWVIVFLALLVAGAAIRRIWPWLGFVVVAVAIGGYFAASSVFGLAFLAAALGVYSMAAAMPPRRWVPLTLLLIPMIIAGHWRESYLGLLDPAVYAQILAGLAIAVMPAMIGVLRRDRRETERQERDLDRRRYAYEERLRIAQEVHDVVGHSLSVINMQAGVALHVLGKRPDQVAESLEAIKRTSKEALAELRTTLEVFREPGPDEPRAPRPGLGRLDDLVGALRSAGREIAVERAAPDLDRLPAAVDQAAFRIIQEALTNVVRHAGRAAASVRIDRTDSMLVVEVADSAGGGQAPLVEGNGIRGMRERARAVGGRLEVGRGPSGGVQVRAELPVVEAVG
jgi:signal transduction histidine kinase